jgi:hypothetical protein
MFRAGFRLGIVGDAKPLLFQKSIPGCVTFRASACKRRLGAQFEFKKLDNDRSGEIIMKLDHIRLKISKEHPSGFDEIWTCIDPGILKKKQTGSQKDITSEETTSEEITITDIAFKILSELSSHYQKMFVFTNDVSENEDFPFDVLSSGSIEPEMFDIHKWTIVKAGYESDYKFTKDPDVSNNLFELTNRDFSGFLAAFIDALLPPKEYKFIFGNTDISLRDLKMAIEEANDDESFYRAVLSNAELLVYGFELKCFVFYTADSNLKDILLSLPRYE